MARHLTADAAGNTCLSGYFSGVVRFSLSSATSAWGNDVFVAKLPPTGNALWVVRGGGIANDRAYGLVLAAAGLLHLAGDFQGSPAFGAVPALVSAGNTDAFVARFGGTVSAVRAGAGTALLAPWPNPLGPSRGLHLALPEAARSAPAALRLTDLLGRVVYRQLMAPTSTADLQIVLPAALAPGRYLTEVETQGQPLRQNLLLE